MRADGGGGVGRVSQVARGGVSAVSKGLSALTVQINIH
jgi:hypothetical protein